MFLQSQKDIDEDRMENEGSIALRCFKPKLISSLNYEQQYLIRRKQKRTKRRNNNEPKSAISQETSAVYYEKSEDIDNEKEQSLEVENNFYKEVYDGNDKISGFWVNGLLQGQAQIEYHNGDYFKGKFEKGYKTEGLIFFKDQGSYEGSFYNQQFHGRGILKLKQKTISAQWSNGLVEGSCVVEYKNGNVYYGPLKEFKKHGYGYLYFPKDSKFFGQFVEGMVKGYGEYFEKGKLKCKGLWKNGKLIQEKRQDDESYNFEDDNINWTQIEQKFYNKNTGVAGVIQKLLNQTNKMQDDQKFKQMLETIKQTSKSNNKKHSNEIEMEIMSEDMEDSEVEKMSIDGDNKQSQAGDDRKKDGLFAFLKV